MRHRDIVQVGCVAGGFPMRTKITCGWLVGHDARGHILLRDADVVFEGNTILFVGDNFPGESTLKSMPANTWSFPGLSTRTSIQATARRTA